MGGTDQTEADVSVHTAGQESRLGVEDVVPLLVAPDAPLLVTPVAEDGRAVQRVGQAPFRIPPRVEGSRRRAGEGVRDTGADLSHVCGGGFSGWSVGWNVGWSVRSSVGWNVAPVAMVLSSI